MKIKDKTYVFRVGLRGAVPIIFAIYPLVENVPHARLIFNIVFFCTLVSLVVQGTSLPLIALWLNLAERPRKIKKMRNFDLDFSTDIKSVTPEIEVTTKILEKGNQIMNLPLPDHTVVIMIRRDDNLVFGKQNTTWVKIPKFDLSDSRFLNRSLVCWMQ